MDLLGYFASPGTRNLDTIRAMGASGGPWYHGTKHEFAPGDMVGHPYSDTYATDDLADAHGHAYFRNHPGPARIYEVEPTGSNQYDGKAGGWYKSDQPMRVVREVKYHASGGHVTEAAARPPRGNAECSCCKGAGEHGDGSTCTSCQGLGHRPRTDKSHCDGQPAPRRRHWRQAAADAGQCPYGCGEERRKFAGTCEYCDGEEEVTSFPHTGLNVCEHCQRVHRDALEAAEEKAGAYSHRPKAEHTASAAAPEGIRMASPEEYGKYTFPDYPGAKSPAALAKHFRKTNPDYYQKLRSDVEAHGVQEPILVRTHNPAGRKYPRPQVMDGHHRAAVAHELGLPLRVGDYDNEAHYDYAKDLGVGRDWFAEHGELKSRGQAPWRTEGSLETEAAAETPSFVHEYETYGPDGTYVTKRRTVHGPFYHGGRAKLSPGGMITPGRKPNSWGDEFDDRGQSTHTYFATEPSTAVSYARETKGHMYEVEPTGESKFDGSGGDGAFKTRHPLRVIRKVPPAEWDHLEAGHLGDEVSHTAAVSAPADDNVVDLVEHFQQRFAAMPKSGMAWRNQSRDDKTEYHPVSVRHAGFAGLVGDSEYDRELREDTGQPEPGDSDHFDEDLWDEHAPEPTEDERRHHEENDGEYPESYDERHEVAYGKALEERQRKHEEEETPDHEDPGLRHFTDTHGSATDLWQKHGTFGPVSLRQPVYATQSHVAREHIERYQGDRNDKDWHGQQYEKKYGRPADNDYLGAKHPLFVTHEGRVHVIEGHHRVATDMAMGRHETVGWHFNLDHHPRLGDRFEDDPDEWQDKVAEHHEHLQVGAARELDPGEVHAPGRLGEQGYTIKDEGRGAAPGQSWYSYHMRHPSGESHGHVDIAQAGRYNDPEREVHIEDLQTGEEHGHKGIASALMDHVYAEHPEPARIHHSLRTGDGSLWWQRYTARRPHITERDDRQRAAIEAEDTERYGGHTAALHGRDELPPDPGTAAIPEGHIRLWHYTGLGNVPSIREHGLQRKFARGDSGTGDLSEPSAGVWASTKAPGELLNSHDSAKGVVEYHAHPDEISGNAESPWHAMNKDRTWDKAKIQEWGTGNHHVIMHGDVPRKNILAVHEPWHAAARYMRDDDRSLKSYQWIKEDYAKGGNEHLEPYIRAMNALEHSHHQAALETTASDDDGWQQAYNNAAERMFGKVHGDEVTAEEDEACIQAANDEHADAGHHEAALQSFAALENPHTHGQEWYHGSPHKFGDFGADAPLSDLEFEHDADNEDHWNTLLGNHFAASHKVAEQFARGEHGHGGTEHSEPANILHARLEMKNPKVYGSEHDLDQEVYEHEFRAGNHHDAHHDPEELDLKREGYGDELPGTYHYAGHNDRLRTRDEPDERYAAQHRMSRRPYATGWLSAHPEKYEIAQRHRQRLIDAGHDGIIYGNEHEKSGDGKTGDLAVIPFHEHQVDVAQRHSGLQCHTPEVASRQWPGRHHPMLPFHEATKALPATGGAMTGPLDAVTEALHTHLAGWQPENERDISDMIDGLPRLFREAGAVFGLLGERATSEMPFKAEVGEHLTEIGSVLGALEDQAAGVGQTYRTVHEADLARIYAGRPAEEIWDQHSQAGSSPKA